MKSRKFSQLDFQYAISDKKESQPKSVKLGNTRVTGKEQFYTPSETAESIFANLKQMIPDLSSKTFLEPAGGTGSFIQSAQNHGIKSIISFDIEPHHPLVKKGNFLQQELNIESALTVSNPPFGRNNALSIPFFNHSARFSEFIVFIVPRSWRKWSVQNKLDRNFHLIKDDDLTINYVDVKGVHNYKSNNLRTCVQYWKKKDELRIIYQVKDMGLITKCSFLEADVSLTIFGFGCGTVKTEFPRKHNSTQMFLKLNHPESLEALKSVDFSRFYKNTAYTEALSIVEINYLLNEYVFNDPMLVSPDNKDLFN